MQTAALALASAAIATAGAPSAGDAMSWAGAAVVLAVGAVVAAATIGVGVAVRRQRNPLEPRTRPGLSVDVEVSPDVAAALERRTLRRGRLRLSDEADGAYPDPRVNAGD
jgi:hypothetical protein